jgi:hypothetical protein
LPNPQDLKGSEMALCTSRRTPALLLAAASTMLAFAAQPAMAAKKSCTRGGAKLEAISGGVRVVAAKGKKQSTHETRRENVYACWAKTGKRTRINTEVDSGLDNIASTRVEIVQERYVGVVETNTGGVSESIRARIYDARSGKLLHDSTECDRVDQGDFAGVDDVVFLDRGGMAMSCRRLFLYRSANSQVEVLEAAGTEVRQLGASRHTRGFVQRLYWTVANGATETDKSLVLL